MSVKPAGLTQQFGLALIFLFSIVGMLTVGVFVLAMIWSVIDGLLSFDPALIVSHIFAGFVGAAIAGLLYECGGETA